MHSNSREKEKTVEKVKDYDIERSKEYNHKESERLRGIRVKYI